MTLCRRAVNCRVNVSRFLAGLIMGHRNRKCDIARLVNVLTYFILYYLFCTQIIV